MKPMLARKSIASVSLTGLVAANDATGNCLQLGSGYTVFYAVPEPSTYALLGGFGALALAIYRRRRG